MKNDELLSWIKEADQEAIDATGTSAGYLKQIAYGNKKASAEIASRLEMATESLVTRQELRPDDWHLIWPELHRVG